MASFSSSSSSSSSSRPPPPLPFFLSFPFTLLSSLIQCIHSYCLLFIPPLPSFLSSPFSYISFPLFSPPLFPFSLLLLSFYLYSICLLFLTSYFPSSLSSRFPLPPFNTSLPFLVIFFSSLPPFPLPCSLFPSYYHIFSPLPPFPLVSPYPSSLFPSFPPFLNLFAVKNFPFLLLLLLSLSPLPPFPLIPPFSSPSPRYLVTKRRYTRPFPFFPFNPPLLFSPHCPLPPWLFSLPRLQFFLYQGIIFLEQRFVRERERERERERGFSFNFHLLFFYISLSINF